MCQHEGVGQHERAPHHCACARLEKQLPRRKVYRRAANLLSSSSLSILWVLPRRRGTRIFPRGCVRGEGRRSFSPDGRPCKAIARRSMQLCFSPDGRPFARSFQPGLLTVAVLSYMEYREVMPKVLKHYLLGR